MIDIGKNNVIITCDNNCAANNVTITGRSLTFQSPEATSATFDQITTIGGSVNFEGGSLRVKSTLTFDFKLDPHPLTRFC